MNAEMKAEVPAPKKDAMLAPRNAWNFFEELRHEMEEMWHRPWMPMRALATPKDWMPAVDIFRKDGDLVVKADLPGMKKEEVNVTLEEGDLLIKGERKSEREIKEKDLYRSERTVGSFFRRIPLTFEADPTKVSARFTDGVLEVHVLMPAEEPTKVSKIPVF